MAKKSAVSKALSPAHLQAIGKVAASWSDLELIMVAIISRLAEIPIRKGLILVGPSNITVWMEIIEKLSELSDENSFKVDKLKPIFAKIKILQTQRNSIVHASWSTQESIGMLAIPIEVTSTMPALGLGVPKRGKKSVVEIKFTSAEMRAIAKNIANVESAMLEWLVLKNSKAPQKLVANALLAYTTRSPKGPAKSHPR